MVVPVVRFGRRLRRASERSQEKVGELATRVHEVVRGNRLIQVSSTQDEEAARIITGRPYNSKADLVTVLTSSNFTMTALDGFTRSGNCLLPRISASTPCANRSPRTPCCQRRAARTTVRPSRTPAKIQRSCSPE